MTYSSCIRQPENNRYIQLHEWQIAFCQGNHCAALVLSYFIAWHDWKIRNDQYYRRFNEIAEMHGDGRPHNENAYLFFTTDQLIEGCMSLYGKKAIVDSVDFLVSINVISIHKNPNPRYHFDKTKYFQFCPQVCNRWIAENYPIESVESLRPENQKQVIDNFDSVKMADRESKNARRLDENTRRAGENDRAITNTTNNTTNKNKQTSASDFFEPKKESSQIGGIEAISDALIERGMPSSRLHSEDDLLILNNLIEQGVTVDLIIQAYDISVKATTSKGNQFGVRYLEKVASDLMRKESKAGQSTSDKKTHENKYLNDFSGGLDWMGDLA